ncbi:MAG: chemotaxis protein CheC [Desulfobacteraceae bacterium]|nr:chemotaxis protein CheC [Desulfobacteraceae bacterium]
MLNELEIDALKEFVNIGFGRSSDELSELLRLHVAMSVPSLDILSSDNLKSFIEQEVRSAEDYSIIQQFFIGNFKGSSYLLLPFDGGKSLLSLFSSYSDDLLQSYGLDTLEKETLLEIGNIVIGSCISKVADVLDEAVSYSPPVFYKVRAAPLLSDDLLNDKGLVIAIKTHLKFEDQNIDGYMFLLSDMGTEEWLQDAIKKFLEPYT